MESSQARSDAGSVILSPTNYMERLNFREIFPAERPVEVEIGAGDGSFVINYAKAHSERNFFAIERLLGRLRKIERKAQRANLQNVVGLRIEASYALEFMLPVEGAEAVHIYFPDPWPKRKHRKNRLINESFPALARRVIRPGGAIYLRTDDLDYFQQMTAVFAGAKEFARFETPTELLSFITDFERNFHARGVPTNHASYRRVE